MPLLTPEFGTAFYVLSLLISGGLFFLFRRLFRRYFAREATVLLATVLAAVVATPLVLLAVLWLVALARSG